METSDDARGCSPFPSRRPPHFWVGVGDSPTIISREVQRLNLGSLRSRFNGARAFGHSQSRQLHRNGAAERSPQQSASGKQSNTAFRSQPGTSTTSLLDASQSNRILRDNIER